MVQRLKINQFYGAPTAFRLLLKFEDSWVKKYDRSSLRTLGSGERLQDPPCGPRAQVSGCRRHVCARARAGLWMASSQRLCLR